MTQYRMFQLEELRLKTMFQDVTTIAGLQQLMYPVPHYNTILNAINSRKLDATLLPTGEKGGGVWLCSISSARNIWPARFAAKELT